MFGQLWVGVKGGVWKQAADGAWSGEPAGRGRRGVIDWALYRGALDGEGGGIPMSHVDFKNSNVACLSLIFHHVACRVFEIAMLHINTIFLPLCRMSLSLMSHVEFKKKPCRCVEFRHLGPYQCVL